MFIVCPHCTTSYAIDLAELGDGRTVRCSRCKEVWLARPSDAVEAPMPMPAMAEAGYAAPFSEPATDWEALAEDDAGQYSRIVDSPPLAADWPEDDGFGQSDDAPEYSGSESSGRQTGRFHGFLKRSASSRGARAPLFNLPAITAAMGALVVALVIWRTDVVRFLPQTAAFYKMVGLDVNLRGAIFKDLKVTTETVDGKPVLVIEGMIVATGRKPVDLPRLRFSVRDAQGAEIYAWNAVLNQAVLNPGEQTPFKSRLASPPAEGRNVDIRFFNRRDVAAGSA
jgi:predicted Zn finger-like uncharacterized protein